MIVEMEKIFIAVQKADQEKLLNELARMELLHLMPVSMEDVADKNDLNRSLQQVLQAIALLKPYANEPQDALMNNDNDELSITSKINELINNHSSLIERLKQLDIIEKQMEHFGNVSHDDLENLSQAGYPLSFYIINNSELDLLNELTVFKLQSIEEKKCIIAVLSEEPPADMQKQIQEIQFPAMDRRQVLNEKQDIEKQLDDIKQQFLAHGVWLERLERKAIELENTLIKQTALQQGLIGEDLIALQGWVPAEQTAAIANQLNHKGIHAGLYSLQTTTDDHPPTLIRYPSWVRPIKGLFDILGTLPGYHEMDIASFFMLALPLFAAMLIGDAGYGLIFFLAGWWLKRKATDAAMMDKLNLLMIIGIVTMIWGMMSANYFGITPETVAHWGQFTQAEGPSQVADYNQMMQSSGMAATVGKVMISIGWLWDADGEAARALLIKISFLIGCIHLIVAHFSRAIILWPDTKSFAECGWCLFLWGMLGVIWGLFFGNDGSELLAGWLIAVFCITGFVLVIAFTAPSRNVLKGLVIGFAQSILPMLSTFSDTMSYIRLMAVGLASYYIAAAFNQLAANVAGSATWGAGAVILLFGHSLNMALCVIAIFAHGVRLNMLEFSNNAGLQWAGYPYNPFKLKE